MQHGDLMDLILQYEDLNEEELILARAHLQACPDCRGMLDTVQSAESMALDPAGIPPLPDGPDSAPSAGLLGEDLRQADASRRELLKKVSQDSNRRLLNPLGWGGLGLALAACLTVILWAPWQGEEPNLFLDLRITSPQVHRGTEGAALQSGDAFVVRFTPRETGWPLVVTQKPDGSLKVLHPRQNNSSTVTAGQAVVLPPTGAPFTWRLPDLATTVWVALSTDVAPDPASIIIDLGNSPDPAQVQSYLVKNFGPQAVSSVQPVP